MNLSVVRRPVTLFPLATHDIWVDEHGEKQQHTQWHNIVIWGKRAEACGAYLAKGRQVYVEGAIRSRVYDDTDGEKRSIVEIIAREVQFLGGGIGKAADADGRGDEDAGVSAHADEEWSAERAVRGDS